MLLALTFQEQQEKKRLDKFWSRGGKSLTCLFLAESSKKTIFFKKVGFSYDFWRPDHHEKLLGTYAHGGLACRPGSQLSSSRRKSEIGQVFELGEQCIELSRIDNFRKKSCIFRFPYHRFRDLRAPAELEKSWDSRMCSCLWLFKFQKKLSNRTTLLSWIQLLRVFLKLSKLQISQNYESNTETVFASPKPARQDCLSVSPNLECQTHQK